MKFVENLRALKGLLGRGQLHRAPEAEAARSSLSEQGQHLPTSPELTEQGRGALAGPEQLWFIVLPGVVMEARAGRC